MYQIPMAAAPRPDPGLLPPASCLLPTAHWLSFVPLVDRRCSWARRSPDAAEVASSYRAREPGTAFEDSGACQPSGWNEEAEKGTATCPSPGNGVRGVSPDANFRW